MGGREGNIAGSRPPWEGREGGRGTLQGVGPRGRERGREGNIAGSREGRERGITGSAGSPGHMLSKETIPLMEGLNKAGTTAMPQMAGEHIPLKGCNVLFTKEQYLKFHRLCIQNA